METGDLFKTRNSLRGSSSSAWRNNGVEVFSTVPSRDEDDEEALKWAALERLPTYDRLRIGRLTTSRGEASEINIDNLGQQERKELIERLKIADDNEIFLLKLRDRIDKDGIKLPTIEVRFEHLNVEAEAYVGSRALPTFLNFNANILEGFLTHLHILPSRKKHFRILKDVSGIIRPSRMTLPLGPPSSGKSTLLLALAGTLDPGLKFSGRVTYNGHDMKEFVPERTAAYINQYDVHIGEMTVRETLDFSARCQGVGSRYEMLAELCRREKEANIKPNPDIDVYMKVRQKLLPDYSCRGNRSPGVTDYMLKVLGLDFCADTMIGDEMRRGISGGQKKRVTTGEMLGGPAKALFLDEISTGLDALHHILDGTAVISLLQPAPETCDLFDDIILLSDGQIVYQGPCEQVLDFFAFVGFKCPERKSVPDFLQEVTSRKDQEQYWVSKDEPYSFITVAEFAEAFRSFDVGRRLGDELADPYDKRKSHRAALTTRKYGVSIKELLKACFSREYLLMKRNSIIYFFKLIQLSSVGVVTMTVFLRTKMHRHSVADGGIFMAKGPPLYPSWAYSLPLWILKIPITFVEVGVWVFMTYYVIGYDPNLFKQYLLLVALTQMASALFRLIAAICRNMIIANTFGFYVLILPFALGGFVLSREDIKKWWIWGCWTSPMMYGQIAIVVNEFLGKSWSHVLPNSTQPLGVEVLKSRGHWGSDWICVLLDICFTLALSLLNSFGKPRTVTSELPDSNDQGEWKGYGIQEVEKKNTTSSGSSSLLAGASIRASNNGKRRIVLSFEPHSITFDEITYSVDMPQEMKDQVLEDKLVLLKDVSGAFKPGVLTALMGVSGAGKTTLMDVLAGRKTGGYIEGNITIHYNKYGF
ncbi:hypothetical protein I3760_01G239000 [Carya illinoinensis]|nr:hypothetical protein I3760_01G239000 [Carya illinoinensis]